MATATRTRAAQTRATSTEGDADATMTTAQAPITEADIQAYVEARVAAAYQLQQAQAEIAEPEFWWDVAAFGPMPRW